MNAKGPVFKYGDNIDTDVIIPARYLNTQSAAELASHCMEDIDKTFITRVKQGDLMVGGENFGCGSSREHAPVAIKAAGISCVIAKSFARRISPASSTATPSTSACRFWSAPPPARPSTRATSLASTLTPALSPTRLPARPSRQPRSRNLSRTSSNRVV